MKRRNTTVFSIASLTFALAFAFVANVALAQTTASSTTDTTSSTSTYTTGTTGTTGLPNTGAGGMATANMAAIALSLGAIGAGATLAFRNGYSK